MSVRVEEIDPGLFLLRAGDRATRFFEGLWEIPEGVTYNAYLLRTSEGAVLFDTWKYTFAGDLLSALESLIDPGELKYVVVHHAEPDHSGSLDAVLQWAPGARVLGHPMAGRLLSSSYRYVRGRFRAVRDGEELVVGGERLVFIHVPWLHWPETMFTWLPGRRVLLTCDAFGGFGIPEGVFDDECAREEDIMRSLRKYVVTVIGHYRRWITRALEKLEGLGVEPRVIAPGHGLLWRGDPRRVMDYYRRLAEGEPARGKVLVVYASMYGTLERLARVLACELRKRGMKPVVYGFTDTTRPNLSDILADAIDAEYVVVAAPTYEAGLFPLAKLVVEGLCEKAAGARKLAVLSTYGWGGVAAKRIRGILESCGYETVGVVETQAVRGVGDAESLVRGLVDAIAGGG